MDVRLGDCTRVWDVPRVHKTLPRGRCAKSKSRHRTSKRVDGVLATLPTYSATKISGGGLGTRSRSPRKRDRVRG